jgi:DNA-binding XRE family transcriptional regulator
MISEAGNELHEYGASCKECGGSGVSWEQSAKQEERFAMCPIALDAPVPLGPEGEKYQRFVDAKNARFRAQGVKHHRIMRGLTQKQMAEQMGIPRSNLAMMETGKIGCSEELLSKAARARS